jgi:hypothetical protein
LTLSVLIGHALEPIVPCLRRWSIPRAAGAFALIDDGLAVVEKWRAFSPSVTSRSARF